MSSNSKPQQPSLQEIAEAQGLTYVEGLGIYSETGEALLQLHPDPEGVHDRKGAYAIPEVVEWGNVHSKEDGEGVYTWSTLFTSDPDSKYAYLHYFVGLDPREDTEQIDVPSVEDAPDLRALVADWREQARRVKR